LSFEFKRLNNQKTARVRFCPGLVPFPREKSARMGQLMQKVVWEAAKPEERREFQELWMEKVKLMLIERKDIDRWLIVE
ncbi:MAG: hypothetical protein HYY29_01565, partial [Chloroflexi bacterium]|nr:hypothetical protein [Chloroflexota bacterium]